MGAKGDGRSAALPDVVSAAERVLSAIDATALAAFQALRAPADEDAPAITHTQTAGPAAATGGGDESSSPAAAAAAAVSSGEKKSDAASTSGGATASPAVTTYKQLKAERDAEKAALLEALRTKLKAQLEMAEVRVAHMQRCMLLRGMCCLGFVRPHSHALSVLRYLWRNGMSCVNDTVCDCRTAGLLLTQADTSNEAAASQVAATAAQLRAWVDTAADKEHALLHARVEAAAGRCVQLQWLSKPQAPSMVVH